MEYINVKGVVQMVGILCERVIGLSLLLGMTMGSPVFSHGDLVKRVGDELHRYYSTEFEITQKEPGEIIIKGEVPSYWDVKNVYRIAAHVRGVNKIALQLDIDTQMVPDKEIQANILHALRENQVLYEPEKITVNVENGLVVLGGTVSFRREAYVAGDIASWQKGVRSVSNKVRVLPPKQAVSDENLTAIVNDVIQRDFPVEKDAIHVAVHNGTVTVAGQVKTLWLRQALEKELKRIQGVKGIENKLAVK